MYLLLAQRQKRPPGIFFKNHHEFRPLEQNQMPHKRHPSLAGNGNAEVEELKGWGVGAVWARACSGKGYPLPEVRSGKENSRERALARVLRTDERLDSSLLPGCPFAGEGAATCSGHACPDPLCHPRFPHLWNQSTDSDLCSRLQLQPVRSLVPWAELGLNSPSVPSFPRDRPPPWSFTIPKVWGKKISLIIEHTYVFNYVNAPHLSSWAESLLYRWTEHLSDSGFTRIG